MNRLKCELWFPTPIWWGMLENISEKDYKEAIEYCINKSNLQKGVKKSNAGGWQSEPFYFPDIVGTPIEKFIKQILTFFSQLLEDTGITKEISLSNMWINVNGKNNFNLKHAHAGADFSGILYLTDNESEIVFEKEHIDIYEYFLRYNGSNRKTFATYKEVSHKTKRGKIIIFPGWLSHSVTPNPSEEKRISIAFNAFLKN